MNSKVLTIIINVLLIGLPYLIEKLIKLKEKNKDGNSYYENKKRNKNK